MAPPVEESLLALLLLTFEDYCCSVLFSEGIMTGLPPSSIDSFTATLEPPATLLAGAGAGAL